MATGGYRQSQKGLGVKSRKHVYDPQRQIRLAASTGIPKWNTKKNKHCPNGYRGAVRPLYYSLQSKALLALTKKLREQNFVITMSRCQTYANVQTFWGLLYVSAVYEKRTVRKQKA